ncbi:MAG: FtsX-like permease family protein, partial [Gemmatimonadota bacterium]
RTPLLVAWAAVALVLLIAAANIASLQLARTMQREHEIAVRAVLGAGRRAIARQLLVESLVVALAGGVVGVLIAGSAVRLVERLGETSMQVGPAAAIDGRVLLFTLGVTLLTGVLTGLLPALRGAGGTAGGTLRRGGRGAVRGRSRTRAALVAAEVAMAVTILVGAGLLGRSLAALRAVDVGVPLENRLTLRLAPAWPEYPERAQGVEFYRRVEERVRGLPGVESVGAANRLPLEGPWWTGGIVFADRPLPPGNERPLALNRVVTPGYVDAVGLRLLRGRLLEESDDADAPPVVLISQSLADRHWPDSDPVGASMAFAPGTGRDVEWSTVVGVVSDARYTSLDGAPDDVVYTSLAQARWGHFDDWGMGLVIATRGAPLAVLPRVREAVAAIDPALPLYEVRTMAGRLGAALEARVDATRLIGAFAALALLLAAVGTWAVIAFNVSRQTPEIGLRLALGETPAAVLRRMLVRGIAPAAAGIAIGLPGAWLGARAIRSQLFLVGPLDLPTFGAAILLLLGISLLACWVPALRASRVGPLSALRAE